MRAYGIYVRVFWDKNDCVNTEQRTFCAVISYFILAEIFPPFTQQNKCQVMFLFRLSASTLSLLQKPSVNIFRTECLPRHQSMRQLRFICFPCLPFFEVVCFELPDKLFVVDNALGIFAFLKSFLASSFCLKNSLKVIPQYCIAYLYCA